MTLQNGLRGVIIPQRSTRTVTVLVLVKTGSKNETKEQNGISHFLEHMFFKGTERRPTPLDVAEVLDEVGGAYNAFTGEEYTGYYAKVNSLHVDLAFDWTSDIFLHSTLPAKEIEKEKGVVLEELFMYRDHPARHTDDLWMRLLYGDQPAGWNIVGTQETITALTKKDLRAYVQKQYAAENVVVCVAGNISVADAIAKVSSYFKHVVAGTPQEKQPVRENQKKPELLLEYRDINQTNIAVGVRGYAIGHKDRYIQHIISVLLGGMMSSRLFVEVREKRGLAYDIATSSESNTDTGYVVTTAGVKKEYAEQAIGVILKEYKKLTKTKVSDKELQKAKENERGRMALRLESSDAKANFYGMQELLRREILTPEQIYGTIEHITPADVKRVANDLFQAASLNMVVLGPYRDKKRFARLLAL